MSLRDEILQKFDDAKNGKITPPIRHTSRVCKHRGKRLQRGGCRCGDGDIWECDILGKSIGKMCNRKNCNKFEPK